MIEASQLSREYLQGHRMDSLKAYLSTLKDTEGKRLKVGGKKGELVDRILVHHGIASVPDPAGVSDGASDDAITCPPCEMTKKYCGHSGCLKYAQRGRW